MNRFAKPLSCALGVVPGPGGTITFVRQLKGPYAGNWLLPGGGIELGETAETAARREILEETGCLVEGLDLFAVYELTGKWSEGDYHLVMFAFLATKRHVVSAGFDGHNVGAVRQRRPDDIDLHSTDLQILTDAGVASYAPSRISDALAADRISMVVNTAHRSNFFDADHTEGRILDDNRYSSGV